MRVVPLVFAVLLAACGPSIRGATASDAVSLHVEPTTVAAGDPVTLTLKNGSSDGVGYNLCTSVLERRSGDDWQALPSDRACTMELRILQPAQDTQYQMALDEALGPGEYRFHTVVYLGDPPARSDVWSDAFEIGS